MVFTVAGAEKREAFARVRAGDDVPAARVRAEPSPTASMAGSAFARAISTTAL